MEVWSAIVTVLAAVNRRLRQHQQLRAGISSEYFFDAFAVSLGIHILEGRSVNYDGLRTK